MEQTTDPRQPAEDIAQRTAEHQSGEHASDIDVDCPMCREDAEALDMGGSLPPTRPADVQNLQDVIDAIGVEIAKTQAGDMSGWFPKGLVQGLARGQQIAQKALPRQDQMVAAIGTSSYDNGYTACIEDVVAILQRTVDAARKVGQLETAVNVEADIRSIKSLNPMTGEVSA